MHLGLVLKSLTTAFEHIHTINTCTCIYLTERDWQHHVWLHFSLAKSLPKKTANGVKISCANTRNAQIK